MTRDRKFVVGRNGEAEILNVLVLTSLRIEETPFGVLVEIIEEEYEIKAPCSPWNPVDWNDGRY